MNDKIDNSILETEYILEIDNIHKSYGKKEVLKGLTLNVKKGEVFGFIGRNGAGKSTTIDCVVGLKEVNSGSIKICGLDNIVYSLDSKMEFGYVGSDPLTYEMMSGNDYLLFVASSYEMSQSSFDSNYNFLKEKFKFTDNDLNRKIGEYSHGMKQKICLMASLIQNPKLWILDEPTVGLDIMIYDVLMNMIKDFAYNGRSVFITSHNIDLVSRVCDRVAIIDNGVVATLIDFNKEPLKRKELEKIFFNLYKE